MKDLVILQGIVKIEGQLDKNIILATRTMIMMRIFN